MAERIRMIETGILPDYDVDDYSEFRKLRTTDSAYYNTINKIIVASEENWNLLFSGFDRDGNPHIFIISERGKITYCDIQRYGAIGTGAFAASLWLSMLGFGRRNKSAPTTNETVVGISRGVASVLTAKFFSETAPEVGQTTIGVITRPFQIGAALLEDGLTETVRTAWNALPKLPDAAVMDPIERELVERFKNMADYDAKYRLVRKKGLFTVVERKRRTATKAT
jgi:hypothetical protein